MRAADQQLLRYLQDTALTKRGPTQCAGDPCSIEEWLLPRARFMPSLPLDDGERMIVVDRFLQSTPILFGWCYLNAARYAQGPEFRYFEGIATHGTPPESHAWAMLNGKLIDPTWNTYGVLPATSSYFGLEVDKGFLLRHLRETNVTGPFVDDFRGGWPVLQGRGTWRP